MSSRDNSVSLINLLRKNNQCHAQSTSVRGFFIIFTIVYMLKFICIFFTGRCKSSTIGGWKHWIGEPFLSPEKGTNQFWYRFSEYKFQLSLIDLLSRVCAQLLVDLCAVAGYRSTTTSITKMSSTNACTKRCENILRSDRTPESSQWNYKAIISIVVFLLYLVPKIRWCWLLIL